jgi:hypothetical protein
MRLSGAQIRSVRFGIQTNILPLWVIEPMLSKPQPFAISTELSYLNRIKELVFVMLTQYVFYEIEKKYLNSTLLPVLQIVIDNIHVIPVKRGHYAASQTVYTALHCDIYVRC